jgi:hypothetical protein
MQTLAEGLWKFPSCHDQGTFNNQVQEQPTFIKNGVDYLLCVLVVHQHQAGGCQACSKALRQKIEYIVQQYFASEEEESC